MATVTLAESAKLSQNLLVAGIIETIITVNRIFEVMPYDGIDGNALGYNREGAIPANYVEAVEVGDTIAAKAPAVFSLVSTPLTTILGDAEVNGLIQATRSNINDQTAVQVGGKAKGVAREWQRQFIVGDVGTNPEEFDGVEQLCAAGQTLTTAGANGDALAFTAMDALLDLVIDRDGEVDWIMCTARTIRQYKALLRALGGASINEVIELPSGKKIPQYSGVGIFTNNWIPEDDVKGAGADLTAMYAGNFDDGSRSTGLAGLTAEKAAGIMVENVGVSETKDEVITRVKWYCAMALFSELGLAKLPEITS